jgi:hypothetical protein
MALCASKYKLFMHCWLDVFFDPISNRIFWAKAPRHTESSPRFDFPKTIGETLLPGLIPMQTVFCHLWKGRFLALSTRGSKSRFGHVANMLIQDGLTPFSDPCDTNILPK